MWERRKKRNFKPITCRSVQSIKDTIRLRSQKLKEQKHRQVEKLENEIHKLSVELKSIKGYVNIRKYQTLREKLIEKQNDLDFINKDKHLEEFIELVHPLLLSNSKKDDSITKQQKHILFLNLFHPDKSIPCFIDRDICKKCNVDFINLSEESMNICPSCGHNEHHLFCKSDFIESEDGRKQTYERSPLYRKYLMQFHEDAIDPPTDVLEKIYKQLSKIHIMLPSKVKPTPIIQILRDEGLTKWVPFSIRIVKKINQEPIAKLSDELIDRLVLRFQKITKAFTFTKNKNRKKILNFEFLTKQFLLMENRADISEWFGVHKTRQVLFNADKRLQECCKIINDDTLNWNTFRSC